MKLGKIKGLIKKTGRAGLYTNPETGEQWVMAGEAYYPLGKMPYIEDIETLYYILDISDKEQEKIISNWGSLPALNFTDDGDERVLPGVRVSIALGDKELYPARTSLGLRFFDTAYMAPLSDMEGLIFTERITESGIPYVAVKYGVILCGIIMPTTGMELDMHEELQILHSEMMQTVSLLAERRQE